MRVWSKDNPVGMELAEVRISGTTLTASGVAIGTEPGPYRLEYDLITVEQFITARLAVRTAGPVWRRALILERVGEHRPDPAGLEHNFGRVDALSQQTSQALGVVTDPTLAE